MDRLHNTIRPYAWGSPTAIPALLGVEPSGEPQAELWMGAHPDDPSRLDRGDGPRGLDEVIAADPEHELGPAAVARFGPRLPFLFKVLAAGAPLSVQVHPDRAQAEAGFAAEEAAGVPQDAPHRNYRDANHKPEMICALDEFTGVCGFRAPADAAALLERLDVPELRPAVEVLRAKPEAEALREALVLLLTLPADDLSRIVPRAAEGLRRAAEEATAAGDAAAARAYADYAAVARDNPADAGALSALLLNHVRLAPGQALYLGAGVPHAYFQGLGVELMANSDNVLRAGLTPKHIDVPELLRIVRFEATAPALVEPHPVPAHPGEQLYPAPIDEFRLSRYQPGAGESHQLPTGLPQILLCTEGTATLTTPDEPPLLLTPGDSCFIPATAPTPTLTGPTTLYRATLDL